MTDKNMTIFEAHLRVKKAMKLIEAIPDDLVPLADDPITVAFNALEDAADFLKTCVDYAKESASRELAEVNDE